MSVISRTRKKSGRMRIAGRLASEVLDFIAPARAGRGHHRQAERPVPRLHGRACRGPCPAPLNYAPPGYKPFPKSICTSVNHQVCHGIPGDRVLKTGRHPQHRRHRHQGRLPRRLAAACSTSASRASRRAAWCDVTYECMWRGIAPVRPGAQLGDIGAAIQAHAEKHGYSRGARVLRPRHRPQVPRGAAGAALRQGRHRPARSSRA